MSQELLTADEVAQRLGLHVRTVRGYIRDGSLAAVRIGKQYRITRQDLEAFTGRPVESAPIVGGAAGVTSIVELDSIDRAAADRITTLVTAAAGGRGDESDGPLRVEAIYEPARERLKVIVVGGLAVTAHLLGLIQALTDDKQ